MPNTFLLIIGCLVIIVLLTLLWTLVTITRVLKTNMDGINRMVYDVDVKLQDILEQVTGSIKNLNSISAKVDDQMDRVEMIIGNAEVISEDIRVTTRTVQRTVVPVMINILSVMQGVKAGFAAWRRPTADGEDFGDENE